MTTVIRLNEDGNHVYRYRGIDGFVVIRIRSKIIDWIKHNVHGGHDIKFVVYPELPPEHHAFDFVFEDPSEAVLFKLTWCGV